MDAAAIEQMNKVRVSLGMAPLPVPGAGPQFKTNDESDSAGSESDDFSTLDKRQAAADDNWQKLENERQEKLDRQRRKDAAKKARDAAQRFTKLEGKGLGDADEDAGELDTRSWLLQQKKRQKKIDKARKMAEELAAREQQAEYTSKDLAGVKVGHEMQEFDDATGEQILTLKDAEIGEDSGDDELENADLRAKEKLEERLRVKKKRPDYDPTEQNEPQGLLSKYDEEIEGKQQKRFTLDGTGNTVEALRRTLDNDGQVKSKGVKISLDMFKDDAPVSDYVDPSTIKVKKPKKKKEKKTRQKTDDDDDIIPPVEPATAGTQEADHMDVDGAQQPGAMSNNKKRAFDFEDDDDLQARLAEQRRSALKKRKKLDAAELARQMREEMPVDEEEPEDGGMTIDETTEFVANLKKPEAAPDARRSRTPQPATADSPGDLDEDEDGDTTMATSSYAEFEDARDRRRENATPAEEVTATGLEDEDMMSGQGIGASVALLRKRGVLSNTFDDTLSKQERQRAEFLATKQHLIDDFDRKARLQREDERRKGTWDKMSTRDREHYAMQQNEARERYLNQLLDEEFKKNYKPTVELRYNDEFGRAMSAKEAFKHMSHMFHGKGSGKQKTEKRLKKIEDEKKELGKGVLNVRSEEGGMMNVQGREGKKQKQAGVRLQ
ncbi:SART-1 protein [Neohortaea acidophila]|uniref:SART-1 protein n=1 Tax=Neohortaea acidophila TaxID=245834 RepID=A0A6A6PH65_9PEZI|nr:SART-1 protein [Neohortaea acidophila]KAF2479081.1 SART-1 protein [Neohortaea acidophila]